MPEEKSDTVMATILSRGGRPRDLDEPGVRVSIWISVSEYDRLCRLAHENQMSISALTRRLLLIDLRP